MSIVAEADVILWIIFGFQRMAGVAETAWIRSTAGQRCFTSVAGPTAETCALEGRWTRLVAFAIVQTRLTFAQ